MALSTLPRTIVHASLHGLRLPLTAVERISGNADSQTWKPALAFETFEASAKRLLGSVLRDDELTQEAALQRAKVAELTHAAHLELEAEQKRAVADAELKQQQERAEEARARIDEQSARHEQELAAEKRAKERQIEDEARARQESLDKVEAMRQKAVTEQERAAHRTRIAEESAAIQKKAAAVAAKRKAQSVDQALETKKAQRKNS